MAVYNITNFEQAVYEIQQQFVRGEADEVAQKAQSNRIMHVAVAIIAGLGSLALTVTAFALLPATVGFSVLLLAPAAILGVWAYEGIVLARCCEIVYERALQAKSLIIEKVDFDHFRITPPVWVRKLKEEVDRTIILNWIGNRLANASFV